MAPPSKLNKFSMRKAIIKAPILYYKSNVMTFGKSTMFFRIPMDIAIKIGLSTYTAHKFKFTIERIHK